MQITIIYMTLVLIFLLQVQSFPEIVNIIYNGF
jgi:hypothetical protein